ncbi:MAG: pyrroline-5-carboxylate reductase [Thermoguttaceae bacterium]
MRKKIGFIGAGQMGTALASGVIKKGFAKSETVFAYDVSNEAAKRFSAETGGTVLGSVVELVEKTDILFLAVKPQQLSTLADLIKPLFEKSGRKLVVSIIAGLTLENLSLKLGQNIPIIRVMPNTPCLVGSGVCGITASGLVSDDELRYVENLLQSVGSVHNVSEYQLDTVTGLSGSGPAFAYMIIEALSDGAVRMGLPRTVALELAARTLKGAAEMVLETGEHPGVLKDKVTSPGGTTIEGIYALEKAGVRHAMISAVVAATEKARELK